MSSYSMVDHSKLPAESKAQAQPVILEEILPFSVCCQVDFSDNEERVQETCLTKIMISGLIHMTETS